MTPREPDRFDTEARAVLREADANAAQVMWLLPFIAAALRAAESSALDAAEASFRKWGNDTRDKRDVFEVLADVRRALIPPAAAPAADPIHEASLLADEYWMPPAPAGDPLTSGQRAQVSLAEHRLRLRALFEENERRPLPDAAMRAALLDADRFVDEFCALATAPIAPAAETGKAQGAEARCPFDEQDCLDARVLLNQCATWMRGRLRHMGTGTVERISCETILAKLAVRVAPPEGEGKSNA